MEHPRWVFILTQRGEILPQELKYEILTQIRICDNPNECRLHVEEGEDWLVPIRLGQNIKPNSIIVLCQHNSGRAEYQYRIFSQPAEVDEIRQAMFRFYGSGTSWDIAHRHK